MPIGFQTGARPANTYIFPPAAAPEISSAGSGKGASLVQLPWAKAIDAVEVRHPIRVMNCAVRHFMTDRGIPVFLRFLATPKGKTRQYIRGRVFHLFRAQLK